METLPLFFLHIFTGFWKDDCNDQKVTNLKYQKTVKIDFIYSFCDIVLENLQFLKVVYFETLLLYSELELFSSPWLDIKSFLYGLCTYN